MSLFLETIKINNGKRINLDGHSDRMNRTRNAHFHEIRNIDLKEIIKVPPIYRKNIVKCRVTYGRVIEKIEFEPYLFKNPQSFQIVNADYLEYDYKSADRNLLNDLYEKRGSADDILMIKKGMLTDSFYANVALLKNGTWYTPSQPLLHGTYREKALRKNRLTEKEIKLSNLYGYEKIRIFNALTEWEMHEPVPINLETILL